MSMWKVVALAAAVGVIAPMTLAQESTQDLRKEIEALKRDMNQLKAENQALAENMKNSAVADTSLEERINALSENLDYAGTTVKSDANPITIFGQFRTRSGWTFDRDFGADFGSSDIEDDDGSFVDALFLVGFDFSLEKDVTTRFSIKSNGLYNNGDTNANDAADGLGEVDLYEGWINIGNIFGRKELSAKEGRQEIVLGNEFQFGNNDYFSGETFDGSHWMWDGESFNLHFLWAKLAIDDNFDTRNWPYNNAGTGNGYDDDELYSLYFTYEGIQDHTIDLYWIYFNGHNGGSMGTLGNGLGSFSTGDVATDGGGFDFYTHTFGLRIGGCFAVAEGLDYNVEFAYQLGDLADTPVGLNDDVEGFTVEVELGITFDATNHFRLFVRFLYAEGADGDDTGYIPLFPERHAQAVAGDHRSRRARYGAMDIIPMDNVLTVQLGLTFDPAADWTLGLTALYAEHDEDVVTGPLSTDDGLGFEIDAFAEYRYSTQTTFSGGIGVFFPEDGAPLDGGGFAGADDDIAFLFYMQARVVF